MILSIAPSSLIGAFGMISLEKIQTLSDFYLGLAEFIELACFLFWVLGLGLKC